MQKLEGCDDRAMVLDGNQLQVLRYGTLENQYPITEVGRGDVTRDDKGRLEAEAFVAEANKAIESAAG